MRLTLRQLEIFMAVAGSGSTTAAAEQLALSQSATSAALNELERALEASLFDRIGKRLLINDLGRMLEPQAKQILAMAHSVEMQFKGNAVLERDLIIGASTTIGTYMLPELIAAYCNVHEKVVPRISITNTADVALAVANFDVEIGFIEGPCHVGNVHAEPWRTDELVIVAAPTHALVQRARKATPAMLSKAKWLLREAGSGTREAVEDALVPHLHYLTEGGEFSSSEAIKHACAAGLGLACLSRTVVADLIELGKLVELQTTLPELRRKLYMVYSKKKLLSSTLKEFRDFARAWQRG